MMPSPSLHIKGDLLSSLAMTVGVLYGDDLMPYEAVKELYLFVTGLDPTVTADDQHKKLAEMEAASKGKDGKLSKADIFGGGEDAAAAAEEEEGEAAVAESAPTDETLDTLDAAIFNLLDLNKDGSVSKAELAAELKKPGGDFATLLEDAGINTAVHVLEQMDADGNGNVDLNEFKVALRSPAAAAAADGDGGEAAAEETEAAPAPTPSGSIGDLAAKFAEGPAELELAAATEAAVAAGYDTSLLDVVATVGKFDGPVSTNNVMALLVANDANDFASTAAALKAVVTDADALKAAVEFVASLDDDVSADDVAAALA